jgi:hypothetical protein
MSSAGSESLAKREETFVAYQHTSAYVSIRQHASAYVSMRYSLAKS